MFFTALHGTKRDQRKSSPPSPTLLGVSPQRALPQLVASLQVAMRLATQLAATSKQVAGSFHNATCNIPFSFPAPLRAKFFFFLFFSGPSVPRRARVSNEATQSLRSTALAMRDLAVGFAAMQAKRTASACARPAEDDSLLACSRALSSISGRG